MQTNIFATPFHKNRLFQITVITIIAFGIILRASKYLPAFSMRGDELAVTFNLLNRSAADLITRPLDSEQAAPVGFVLLVKALMTIFGHSEYFLRLVAFAAGCLSLVAMQSLLSKTVGRYGNILALAAFAFSDYLIYYSAELKQYSSDVLVALILLLVFYRHLTRETDAKDFVLLAILGILAFCFSYPAIFVMAGIGITLFLHYWKDKQKLLWIVLTGVSWAAVFLALYFLLLRQQTQSSYLITFWDNLLSFMPMPPWRDITWFPKALTGLFFVVAGLSSSLLLVLPVYILGLWGFWREAKWQWILALTLPVAINILVSGFHKYPFHGRLILYLLPLVFVVLGKGVDLLMHLIPNRVLANLAFAGLLILFLRPVVSTVHSYLFTQDYLRDDLKPVMAFVRDNRQDGDILYLYHYTAQPFTYYAPQYGLETMPTLTGQNNSRAARKYREEFASLPRGQRIWFVFSFVNKARVRKGETRDEREYMLGLLEENGMLVSEYYSANNASSVHLFILK